MVPNSQPILQNCSLLASHSCLTGSGMSNMHSLISDVTSTSAGRTVLGHLQSQMTEIPLSLFGGKMFTFETLQSEF